MSRHCEERTAEQERLEVRRSRLERSETVDNYNQYNSTGHLTKSLLNPKNVTNLTYPPLPHFNVVW